jgi:uncharacterized membrane protein
MKAWLTVITEHAILIIDAMALVLIFGATVVAFLAAIRALWSAPLPEHERRAGWLRYARWLVAGLTFQLAADIMESSIATNWESVGRLAAIAAIRTFLNYFLERDVAEVRVLQRESALGAPAEK